MSTPLDFFGQSMSQGINVLVTGLKSFDNFGRSTINSLNRGIPTPQNAMNQILSLPQSLLNSTTKGLPLPNLGQAGAELSRSLNVSLPNLRQFGQLLPSLGGAEGDASIFGETETQKNTNTRIAANEGVSMF